MSIDVKKLLESRPVEFVAAIELQDLKWGNCGGCYHSFVATLDLPGLLQSDVKQVLQSDYACTHYEKITTTCSSERYFLLYFGGVDGTQLNIFVQDDRFNTSREFKKNLKREKKNGTPVILSIKTTLY